MSHINNFSGAYSPSSASEALSFIDNLKNSGQLTITANPDGSLSADGSFEFKGVDNYDPLQNHPIIGTSAELVTLYPEIAASVLSLGKYHLGRIYEHTHRFTGSVTGANVATNADGTIGLILIGTFTRTGGGDDLNTNEVFLALTNDVASVLAPTSIDGSGLFTFAKSQATDLATPNIVAPAK